MFADRWIAHTGSEVDDFYRALPAGTGVGEETQIWIAVSMYMRVAIMRKRLGLEGSLYQILQILSVTLFEKTPILRALHVSNACNDLYDPGNQLILFDI